MDERSLGEAGQPVISDAELRDFGPHGGHDPVELVTEDRRHPHEVVRGEQEVGVAQPGGSNLDEDLPPHRRGEVHVLELEPAADGVQNECLHTARACAGRRRLARQALSRKRRPDLESDERPFAPLRFWRDPIRSRGRRALR
jgi:hypothetical protein